MEHWAHYYNEGITAKIAKDFERSAEYHLKVLELEPQLEMPEAWHNAGAALLRIQQKEAAQPYFEKAIELYDLVIDAIRVVEAMETEEMLFPEGEEEEYDEDEDGDDFFDGEDDIDDDEWMPDEFFTEEDFSEYSDEELYGDEPVAYYLFWRTCCYALMERREAMYASLTETIAEDDWYAIEALEEEDLVAYRDEEAFRKLVGPVLEKVQSPEHKHLFDIFERIEKRVLLGFEDPEEFEMDVIVSVEQEGWADETPRTWIRKTARDLHRKQLEQSRTWEQPTDLVRLAMVFDTLCDDGIAALHAISSPEELREVLSDLEYAEGKIHAYAYYLQENAEDLLYQTGDLQVRFGLLRPETSDKETTRRKLTERLQEAGFNVEYTQGMAITITGFNWKKVYVDDEDQMRWDHWRLFEKF